MVKLSIMDFYNTWVKYSLGLSQNNSKSINPQSTHFNTGRHVGLNVIMLNYCDNTE